MSYDIQVWSVAEPDWQQFARDLHGWKPSNRELTFQTTSWQIVVGPTSRVEEEDIPDAFFGFLPGIQYLTKMNLEPTYAPEAARRTLQTVAVRIAKAYYGIVLDPQTDTITSPRGMRRIGREKPAERITVMNLAWWFNHSPLIEQGGLARFVATLERYLPEALPRRYGRHEPPQYRYETQGKAHFVQFLASESQGVVWYAHYPVLHVWPGVYGGYGPGKQGYKANHLDIQVDSSVWSQPGWELALQRFWHQMSDFIRPFFGEVRLLRNYKFKGGRLLVDRTTETHPVRNGWWNGVPRQLGPAVVIDRNYAELWPEFVRRGLQRNGLHFISSHDWIRGKRVDQLLGGVPRGIAQGEYSQPPPRSGGTTYPTKWPFEYPFVDE